MTMLDTLIAYREAVTLAGATSVRRHCTTEEAAQLIAELDVTTCRHPERLSAAHQSLRQLQAATLPTERRALTKHLNSLTRAEADLWDAFHGELVQGVEIIRRQEESQ